MHVSDKEFNAQVQIPSVNGLNRYFFLITVVKPDQILAPAGRRGRRT